MGKKKWKILIDKRNADNLSRVMRKNKTRKTERVGGEPCTAEYSAEYNMEIAVSVYSRHIDIMIEKSSDRQQRDTYNYDQEAYTRYKTTTTTSEL